MESGLMDALSAAFGLLTLVLDLVKQAQGASQAKHDAIVAAMNKAADVLKTERDAAHASVDADNADMAQALKDADPTKPGG
jgi:hypothetical protein